MMFPQIVQSDSAKKSSDKLPFAPFLNPEKTNQSKENVNKKSDSPVLKKKIEKATDQKTTVKQNTDPKSLEQQPNAKQNIVLKSVEQNQGGKKNSTEIAKDSVSIVQKPANGLIDTLLYDSTLAQTQTSSDSFSFRFSDDDTSVSVGKNQNQFSPSGKYFTNHLLQSKSDYPLPYSSPVPDWFSIAFILIICGITTIKIFYSKIFKQLFDAFYSLAVTNQVVRDENILVQRASVLLNVIFYGIAALFLYYISVLYNWNNPFFNQGIFRFFLFAIIIACFYSIKMLILKMLGYILEIEKPVAVYIFNIFLINNILGMALIPVVALLAYVSFGFTHYVLFAGVTLVIASFLYRMFRAFSIGSSMSLGSLYYLFIYFCALEIAPVLVLVKFAGR